MTVLCPRQRIAYSSELEAVLRRGRWDRFPGAHYDPILPVCLFPMGLRTVETAPARLRRGIDCILEFAEQRK